MSIQQIQKLHLWTAGDPSVGISGETAEVSAPGWLISSQDYDPDGFRERLEEFRQKVREAFEVIWPNEKVHTSYDFELAEEDAQLNAVAD
ncbi:hypothetical protein PZT57_26015 [Pseudomonas aeruginosa]|uniref:hypothetical protein n=1 Tax=Pseudomonas aeruginosa TaxID=287 RepID=UPI002B27AC65|nr:hypothetical protein [Pseudomonas aeruginosa]MEA8592103.1 hypothetical protein [Pseudomonas aeruginosa]